MNIFVIKEERRFLWYIFISSHLGGDRKMLVVGAHVNEYSTLTFAYSLLTKNVSGVADAGVRCLIPKTAAHAGSSETCFTQ